MKTPELSPKPILLVEDRMDDIELMRLALDHIQLRSYLLRANSYICKPVDCINFAEALRLIYFCWLGLNVPPPEPA